MKKEDFQKLKAIVEDNGFVMLNESENENEKFAVIGLKKDPWEGVEFIKHLADDRIYLIDSIEKYGFCVYDGFISRQAGVQSTIEAYLLQLKNECFERFGEIKRGDLFDRGPIDSMSDVPQIIKMYSTKFSYEKKYDRLMVDGSDIYEKGKWAKRVEYVKVEFVDDSIDDFGDFEEHGFVFRIPKFKIKPDDKIGEYLAKKLEKYLNNQTK